MDEEERQRIERGTPTRWWEVVPIVLFGAACGAVAVWALIAGLK